MAKKIKVLTELDFQYICDLTFDELEGASRLQRYCKKCSCIVHNLAMYSDEGLQALIEDATAERKRLCVAAPPRPEKFRTCERARSNMPMGWLRKPSAILKDQADK